jgi:hypothetical protein
VIYTVIYYNGNEYRHETVRLPDGAERDPLPEAIMDELDRQGSGGEVQLIAAIPGGATVELMA